MLSFRPLSFQVVCSWAAAAALVLTVVGLTVHVAHSARQAQLGLQLHQNGELFWRGRPFSSSKPAGRRLRLVPHPSVPWGLVLGRAQELQEKGFAIEIQLPPL